MFLIFSLKKVPFLAESLTDDLITVMAKNVEHIRITKAYVQLDVKDMEKLLKSRHLQLSRENAMTFLSVWAVASGPSLTRSNKISLERLANTPTCFRVPTTVVLATGGWSHVSAMTSLVLSLSYNTSVQEPTNLVEVWNPLTEQWMASDVKLPGCSRAYHGLEVLGSDIWAIGGYSQSGGFQRSTMKFSLSTAEWREMSRMSINRCYVSTNVLAGKIYALGGHAGGSAERLRSAEVYSPETNQWADISPMLYNRSDFASVVYRGKIFAIGGFHGFHYQSSFEAYDPESDSWTFEGNLQIARSGASAVVAGDKIFILGGFDGGERLASVECITPGLVNTVRHEVPPMLHRRSNFSALLLDPDTIMVVGGFRKDPEDLDGGEVSGEVELLDLTRNVWTVAPNLTVPRSALQAIKVENMYRSFV